MFTTGPPPGRTVADGPLPILTETIDITDDDIEIDVNPSSPISQDPSSNDNDDDDGDDDDNGDDDDIADEDNGDDNDIADEDHDGDEAVNDDADDDVADADADSFSFNGSCLLFLCLSPFSLPIFCPILLNLLLTSIISLSFLSLSVILTLTWSRMRFRVGSSRFYEIIIRVRVYIVLNLHICFREMLRMYYFINLDFAIYFLSYWEPRQFRFLLTASGI